HAAQWHAGRARRRRGRAAVRLRQRRQRDLLPLPGRRGARHDRDRRGHPADQLLHRERRRALRHLLRAWLARRVRPGVEPGAGAPRLGHRLRRGGDLVKLALMYELPVPRPWNDDSAYIAFEQTLQQIELADRLGFHSVWTVEHHFLDAYSFSSAPGVLYGAIA